MNELQVHRKFALEKLGEELFREFLLWAKKKNISGEELLGDMNKTLMYILEFDREKQSMGSVSKMRFKGAGRAVFEEKELETLLRSKDPGEILSLKNFGTEKGFGFVANKQIPKYKSILQLKPSWIAVFAKNICSFCGFEEATISCSNCKWESYCSVHCRDQAKKTYHEILCKKDMCAVMERLSKSPISGTRYNLFIYKIFAHMLIKGFASWKEIESIKFLSGFQAFEMDPNTHTAAYRDLCKFFEEEKFEKIIDFEQYINLVSVITINVFGWYSQVYGDKPSGNFGLFTVGSFFNHECDPNCEYYFENGKMSFVSMKPIEVGQELFISYVSEGKSYDQRAKALSMYGFVCNCKLCISERAAFESDQ